MKYSDLLSKFIEDSGLSLGEIAIRLSNKNIKIDRSYISKLKNGNKPPASEDVTRALAEVTGGDIDALLLAGHIEKAPDEIKSYLKEATDRGELFAFFGFLMLYVEHYRETGTIDEDLLKKIEFFKEVFSGEYKYWLDTSQLKNYPEYALVLMTRLKQHFIPLVDSISFQGEKINFSDYITPDGKPIFKENPYPEMINHVEKNAFHEEQTHYVTIHSMNEVLDGQTQKKIDFFTNLEEDLGLNLADPEVQKKLKRAAKIIFSDED